MTASVRETSAPVWKTTAIAHLLDDQSCPRCGVGAVRGRRCATCGADYAEIGDELWDASQQAVAALRHRQSVLERVPVVAPAASASRTAASTARVGPAGRVGSVGADAVGVVSAPAMAPASASATVQSVLAVAGAGLVAVAAVVFAFFNPDLTDSGARAGILGTIAALFLGAAVVMVRRGLRFSAEAVGGLGVVFVGLTVASALPLLPAGIDPWVATGLAMLAGASAMTVVAVRLRLRVWLWSALTALAFVPLLLGAASPEPVGQVAATLAGAAAAAALVALTTRLRPRVGSPLAAEVVTLTVLEVGFAAAAVLRAPGAGAEAVGGAGSMSHAAYAIGAAAAVAAVIAVLSARHPAGRLWSWLGGGAAVVAAAALTTGAMVERIPFVWLWAVVPAAAVLTLVLLGLARLLHRLVFAPFLFGGAVTTVGVLAAPPTFLSLVALTALQSASEVIVVDPIEPALLVAAAALAIGLATFARLTVDPGTAPGTAPGASEVAESAASDPSAPAHETPARPLGTAWLGYLAQWYGVLALLLVLTLPAALPGARIALGIAVGAALAALVAFTPLRRTGLPRRLPFAVGAHALVILAAALSWQHPATTVWAGVAAVGATLVLARTVPAPARFVHTGAGFAYALVVLATALDRAGVPDVAVLSLTTTAAGLGAIAATFLRRVEARSWYAVLVVTAVPFVIGVALVVGERSGWTALSTAVILFLSLALTVTRRTGLGAPLRTAAAGLIVPSAAVVAVCLGAQFLEMSGSPVVLPVVAVLVAAVLASAGSVQAALAPRIGERDATATRIAVEISALVTAAIAVGLALVREAAGAPTAFVVLVVLAVGFGAQARYAGRRYGWWLAGAALTGALWSLWALVGVDSFEAHLLPPALGAAVVGLVLTARGSAATGVYAAGLLAAVAPLLVAEAVLGTDAPLPWRAYGLVAASWALVGLAALLGRRSSDRMLRLGALRPATLAAAILAAAAGPIEGMRWGLGVDAAPGQPLIIWALALGAVSAGAATVAARMLRARAPQPSRVRSTRWLAAPAVLYTTVGVWPAIERDWPVIWTMWGLLIGVLALMVVAAARALRGGSFLPPVWFLFGVAFVTAVVAWSPRDLRVEWFSLPLGLFLVSAGALGLRASAPTTAPGIRSLTSWPAGWAGSWALLAPGVLVTFSASVAATYTDPQTWRAILVMALALVAILVGSAFRLAAPFIIGVVVLPIENVLAFMVQIGRGIESMPWWITLSVVGAVLLIIAVTYERRAGEGAGIAARVRDLR